MSLTLHYDWAGQGSAKPRNGQGPTLTVVRAQPELIINSDGYYEEVPANELRFEYGKYINNQHADSNNFGTGSYFKLNSTVAQNATDRNGIANNAWAVSGDGLGPGTPEFTGIRGDAQAGNTTMRRILHSWYVKAGAVDWVMGYSGSVSGSEVWFNIREGYIGTQDANIICAGMHPAGNDFYRIWLAAIIQSNAGDRGYLSACDNDGVIGIVNNTPVSDLFYVQDYMYEDITPGKWIRQNYLQGSTDPFNTGGYLVNARAEKLATNLIGPNGGKVCELRALNLGGSNDSSIRIVPTMQLGDWAWYSVDVKKDTLDYVNLRIVSNDPQSGNCYFNFLTGAFTNVDNARFSTHVEQKRDGWWRISVLHRVEAAGVNYYINLSNTDSTTNVPLDGVSNVLFADPQVQTAKPFETKPGAYLPVVRDSDGITEYYPSAYVETGASAVTQRIDAPCVLKGDGRTGGLRIDYGRENLCVNSNNLAGAQWTPSAAVVNTNLVLGPDGRLTADELRDNNDAASGAAAIGQFVAVANSEQYLSGFVVKQGSNRWIAVAAINFTTPVNSWAYFDIQNGVLGSKDAGIDLHGMKDLGNGWYYCWIVYTTDAADNTGAGYLYLAASDGSTTITRDNTNFCYVWNASTEGSQAGSSFNLIGGVPYPIITGGITASIDKDDVKTTEIDWHNPFEGMLYLRFYSDQGDLNQDQNLLTISNDSTTYLSLNQDGTTARNMQPSFRVRTKSSNIDSINGGIADTPNDETIYAFAGSWKTNDVLRFAINGSAYASAPNDDAVLNLDNVTNLRIGQNVGVVHPGVYQELRYYNRAAVSDEMVANMSRVDNPIFPGYDPNRKKKAAIDAALWNKAMNARTKEADSDGDYTPFNNVG